MNLTPATASLVRMVAWPPWRERNVVVIVNRTRLARRVSTESWWGTRQVSEPPVLSCAGHIEKSRLSLLSTCKVAAFCSQTRKSVYFFICAAVGSRVCSSLLLSDFSLDRFHFIRKRKRQRGERGRNRRYTVAGSSCHVLL